MSDTPPVTIPMDQPQEPHSVQSSGETTNARVRGLSGSFTGFLKPIRSVVHISGNICKDMYWPGSSESMLLASATKDREIITRWASHINNNQIVTCEVSASGQVIREVLREPRNLPAVVFFFGHTIRLEGEGYFLPADWLKDRSQAVSFSEMRQLVLGNLSQKPLLLVTDFCDCDNILGLPYVLCIDSAGARWLETGYSPATWAGRKEVLHYAATKTGHEAYDFPSTGGIFTREFCNIPLRKKISLLDRSKEIQTHVDNFLDEYSSSIPGKALQQQHQVFSSHKLELNDPNVLRCLFK